MQKEADPESDRHPDPHTQEHHEQKPSIGSARRSPCLFDPTDRSIVTQPAAHHDDGRPPHLRPGHHLAHFRGLNSAGLRAIHLE